MSSTAQHWADVYLIMVADCERNNETLTEWERTFIACLRTQLEHRRPPTPKQTETLEQVWQKTKTNAEKTANKAHEPN